MRILLIDDNTSVLNTMQSVLEVDGHEVVAANGGQQGIDTFNAALASPQPFELVMTDLGMPEVDGRQVARAVKQASSHTPVILLTGSGESPERIVRSDFDLVMAKPPRLRELRAALQSLKRR